MQNALVQRHRLRTHSGSKAIRVYGYLRASTKAQDAERAKAQLYAFAEEKGLTIAHCFTENESGATLKRPKLFELLDIAESGDALLVEQVDRISRLNTKDWETLKAYVKQKGIRIVALDLPTSHQLIHSTDAFTERMIDAVNAMLLDMLAAIARKDYEDRRRRQDEGIQKAKAQGKYTGGKENKDLHRKIELLLREGKSYSQVQDLLGCSRHTIAKVSKRIKASSQDSSA